MKGWYEATLTMMLESPFLSASLDARPFGVDVGQLRGDRGGNEFPIFAGSQLRGLLRHALTQLREGGVEVDAALDLFGDEGEDNEAVGQIAFSDAFPPTALESEGIVTRIRVNPKTGAVQKGALLTAELCRPVGEKVAFAGTILYYAADADRAKQIATALENAAKQVRAMGAFKTAGFGRVEAASVEGPPDFPKIAVSPSIEPNEGARQRICFTVAGHLLVDAYRPEQNVLIGAEEISGAALKGALAYRLKKSGASVDHDGMLDGDLGKAFSRMILSFARPQGVGPPAPLSWMQFTTDREQGAQLRDAVSDAAECLLSEGYERVPAFASDFKDGDWAYGEAPEAPTLPRETRTRLAIDPDSGAAKPAALFSHRFLPNAEEHNIRWSCIAQWPDDDPPAEYYEILAHLRAGLPFLGRLKASVLNVEVTEESSPKLEVSRAVVITLETPHWMLRAADLKDESSLATAVERYFADASHNRLKLARDQHNAARLFAAQDLRGGFQAARYRAFGDCIEPFVLMRAGSVFVLETDESLDCRMILEAWSRYGLPDVKIGGVEPDHTVSPFLRSNGFGAVLISPLQISGRL